MKIRNVNAAALIILMLSFAACKEQEKGAKEAGGSRAQQKEQPQEAAVKENHQGHARGMRAVQLSQLKFNSLGIKVDTIPEKPLKGLVKANGELEVPPQHEATVTAILGANISTIKVIEGEEVKKGQVLAYLSHPTLTRLQSDYAKAYSQLKYLKQENQRQKKLYEEEVGSGKEYQKTKSEYMATRAEVQGLGHQLQQLSLNVNKIQDGEIYNYIPVVSPIKGFVEKVKIQVGQYVKPQTAMFMVVNNEHVHADLMVFEKDVSRVNEGQKIMFTVESAPESELSAEIYSVGKTFEKDPKAVHVHAEIKDVKDYLIPGMYINGKINTGSQKVKALPEEAIIEEGGSSYIFTAQKKTNQNRTEWHFKPVEIKTGMSYDGWTEVKYLDRMPPNTTVAWNNAYYLISEMKKSEASHSH